MSNHHTDIDSVLINISFNRLLRVVATDNIFKKGPFLFLLNKFGVIPKRKGKTDIAASYSMMKVLSSKQCLVLFPEGNRTYAEFQYYVSDAIIKLIKKGKPTLILFNLHGGNGTRPRFKHKVRHGKFYGTIKKVMKYEEYKDIPDDELLQIIMDNLKVYDSESGELYKSRTRAEYLERMFFVCPKCNSAQTLYSKT